MNEIEQRGRDIGILVTKNEELEAEVERLRGREAELEGILRVEEMYQKEMKAEVERLRGRITELEARNLYLRSLVEDDEEGPVEEKHRLERELGDTE